METRNFVTNFINLSFKNFSSDLFQIEHWSHKKISN